MLFNTQLKLVCKNTDSVFLLDKCNLQNKVIYSGNLDAPIKCGDKIIKTWSDGYEEEFRVIRFIKSNGLQSRLIIDIK